MPRSVKSKTVFLVSRSGATGVEHIGALTSFRAAYNWILFKGSVSSPSMLERPARLKLRLDGVVGIYDTARFETRESAMWSQDSEFWWITEIPIIRILS